MKTIKICLGLYLIISFGWYSVSGADSTPKEKNNSTDQAEMNGFVDEFLDEAFPSSLSPSQILQQSNQTTEKEKIETPKDSPPEEKAKLNEFDFEKAKQVFKYATYADQVKLVQFIKKECEKSQSDLGGDSRVSSSFKEKLLDLFKGYLEKPFENDFTFLRNVVELIGDCQLLDQLPILEDILLSSSKLRKYPPASREQLQKLAWEAVAKLSSKMDDQKKVNFGKLSSQFFNKDNLELKKAALDAAEKLSPENFNRRLILDYRNEKNFDMKVKMIQVIASYQNPEDIDFLKRVIDNEEESKQHRWVALVAMTNYTTSSKAKEIVINHLDLSDPEMVARAYYALGYFDVEKDIFVEGSKRNNDIVRLEAIKQLKKYPLEEVEDLLRYKADHDSNNIIREEAKKILADLTTIGGKTAEGEIIQTNQ